MVFLTIEETVLTRSSCKEASTQLQHHRSMYVFLVFKLYLV